MKYLRAILYFILPSCLLRLLFRDIGKNAKIGFSIIITDKLFMASNCQIGNFVFILVPSVIMEDSSRIKFFTIIKGKFNVRLEEDSTIGKCVKIVNPLYNDKLTTFFLGKYSTISSHAFVDVSRDVSIGHNSCLAGIGTQVFTHSFYHMKDCRNVKVVSPVKIGNNVYVGTRSILLSGITIADNITVGAGAVIGIE